MHVRSHLHACMSSQPDDLGTHRSGQNDPDDICRKRIQTCLIARLFGPLDGVMIQMNHHHTQMETKEQATISCPHQQRYHVYNGGFRVRRHHRHQWVLQKDMLWLTSKR